MSKQGLIANCRSTVDAAAAATQWFAQNTALLRQEAPLLTREFRRHGHAARRLLAAVERPMCVGVFGPSQSGKSYLISALARSGTRALVAEFEGFAGGLDFVRHINPENNRESTGLVTRFSIRRRPTPAGHPVALKLLSQTDLVKILGNTYFSDCDLSEAETASAEKIGEVLKAAQAAAAPRPAGTLTEDDVFDLQDYFESRFKGEPLIKALQAGDFWAQAAEVAPRLRVAELAALWAPLWGEVEAFGALYSSLHGALEQLSFAREAYCGLEALVDIDGASVQRRSDSIINVETLGGLGAPGGAMLAVMAGTGSPVSLPRSSVTALVAEFAITMRDKPWPFFDDTDLLDFPGARSREITPLKSLEDARTIEGLFLRGKVAYLFESYCAEQELTSMLLCIGPSNQEVRTLPGIVKEWIDATHGPDPRTRAENRTALFLVLTKFDAEFAEGVGSIGSEARWTARLNASLLDYFGKLHDWPQQWHPGRPFDNTYWLRNPNFKAKHILDYGPPPQELEQGIRTSEQTRIARSREDFVGNAAVQAHFADPARAWDEAFRLNDGGVGYLAERLSPVCNPEIKLGQIQVRLQGQRLAMSERLGRYFVGGDLLQQKQERLARAEDILEALRQCAQSQRFARLLSSMQLRDGELADILYRVNTEAELHPARSSVESLGTDRESRYADAIMAYWLERLRNLPMTPPMCRWFGLPESAAEGLVGELTAGARRLDLQQALVRRLREARGVRKRLGESIGKPALLAAESVNAYVAWLGFDPGLPGTRPTMGSGKTARAVFEPPPAALGRPALAEQPARHDLVFFDDWCSAFRALVEANAMDEGGQLVDLEQNRRLGELLERLQAA